MLIYDYCNSTIRARGFQYYKAKRIRNVEKVSDSKFTGLVDGNSTYHVTLDLNDYNKCHCDCLYKRKICKHIVALYFEVNKQEADSYEMFIKSLIEEKIAYDNKKQEEYLIEYNRVKEYVESLSNEERKQELITRILIDHRDSSYSRYDERYEEEFEILDEIDWELLK